MKKFTFLMIALFIAAMGFAQLKVLAPAQSLDKQKVEVQNKKFIKGNSMQTRNTRALECADNALFSTVDLDACQSAGTSNTSSGYLHAMRVDGFSLPLSSIRFFGAQMIYSGGWSEVADVESLNFNIKIYADNNNMPGSVVETVSGVSLTHTATEDLLFSQYSIFQFDYTFETPVDVPSTFWIEISNTDENVWFMWLDNESGDFTSAEYDMDEETWEVSTDAAYQICLVPQAPANATIVAMPLSLSFNGVIGGEIAAKTVSISTFNLTEAITATTAAPFSVSSDGTTFAETASIAAAGGVLYVKYTPTAEGTQNGTVVLASTGAENVTVTLTGSAVDCSNPITTLPFVEGFENMSGCWTLISNNAANDLGTNYGYGPYTLDGEPVFRFSSYSRAGEGEDYNQYLITPELGYTEDVILSFDYAGEDEEFRVLVSTTNNDIASFTALGDDMVAPSDDFETYIATIPAGTKYVAINYFSNYAYYLYIDNFSFAAVPTAPEIALISVSPATGTTVQTGVNVTLSGVVKNNGSALTSYKVAYTVDANSPAEYNVTGINVATGENNEFTHTTPIVFTETGEHTIVVTISNPNGEADSDDSNNSITVVWNAISCDAITEFPYEEGFDNGIPECWTIIDADGDGHNWMALTDLFTSDVTEYVHGGTDAAISQSYENYVGAYDANNWMISSAITVPSEGEYLAAWWARSMDASYADSYSVYIGTEPTVAGMTANAAILSHTPTEWEMKSISLAAYSGQTIYIGFNHVDNDKYVLMIDDFSVFAAPTTAEIALTSVTPANNASIPSGQDITIGGVVTNNGVALTSYKVAYTVDNGEAVEYDVTGINVALGETHNFTHTTPISGLTTGAHTIVVTVSDPNGAADGDASDNSMTINITVTAPLAYGCYFETDPEEEGWTFVDSDNDGNNWTWENSASTPHMTTYEGIGCIYSASYASVALTPDNWAISPAIQIENGPITVSFYAKGQDADYAAEHFQIYAGTSADVTAMTAVSEEFVATGEYTQYTANLPESYVGQVIYVAIRHFNVSDEFVLVVDNFEVLAYGHVVITDIEENIAESIAVYPNPTSSMVTIANAEGKDIIVVNSLGQVVASIENAAANQTIDVTNFANGTYFVKVDGEWRFFLYA